MSSHMGPLDRAERARMLREEREARLSVVSLFQRLGYDLTDPDEINRLNENLRYAERQRRRYEVLEGNKLGWLVSLILVIAGASITAVVQWFTSIKGHG